MQHDFIPYVTSRKNQAIIDHREHLGEENKSRYRKHLLVDEIVLIKLNTKYPCKLTKLQSYKKTLSRPHIDTTGIAAGRGWPRLVGEAIKEKTIVSWIEFLSSVPTR